MTTKLDGGPAFPSLVSTGDPRDGVYCTNGLSMRDWFSGNALSGMLSQGPGNIFSETRTFFQASFETVKKAKGDSLTLDDVFDDVAETAYRIADAMLKAREK